MKNPSQTVKTYISEANQNRISDTLSVERENQSSAPEEKNTQPSSADTESGELTKKAAKTVGEKSDEPEALSAEAENLPPTAASADAEAVAGLPIGGIHGHEGDQEENQDH
jgi:hypothetical protein